MTGNSIRNKLRVISSRLQSRELGFLFGCFILVRNLVLLWEYSYTFLLDSALYIRLGHTFFNTWDINTLVTFPYPLLNALAFSYWSPYLLLIIQVVLTSLAGGFFIHIIARRTRLLAIVTGLILFGDLVWGSFSRTILTDSLFGALNLLSLGLLLDHFDRRNSVKLSEMFPAGLLYGVTLIFRPSNIFLGILLVPCYLFLIPNWRKLLLLLSGGAVVFLTAGFINLAGNGSFYILSGKDSYTSSYVAYPLFIYNLYSPDNGVSSKELDAYLSRCYPGQDLFDKTIRYEGQAVDSVENMKLIMEGIIPCVKKEATDPATAQQIFSRAYLESLLHSPGSFIKTMLVENDIFFRYNAPYILRWQLDAENNYGCTDLAWCDTITQSRASWNGSNQLQVLYEKVATKIIQAYLLPVRLFTAVVPEKMLPFSIAWFGMLLLLTLVTRGRERFLALSAFVILQYTALTVVAGFGFTERYAAMMTPIHAVLSGLLFTIIFRWINKLVSNIRKPIRLKALPPN